MQTHKAVRMAKKLPFALCILALFCYNLSGNFRYAGVAQLFRALPCQGRGRELESLHPHQLKNRQYGGFLVEKIIDYISAG